MPKFPHLEGSTDFPHIGNIDVYKYADDFDYSRFTPTQMKVTLCAVPWDMGEAHIGARTISGIGNVVHFGSAANRDAWFAAIPDSECYRFDTKYKELHRDGHIDLPVPFDVAARFNYVTVEYSLFANDASPVMYERGDGVRNWFWFVREVEMLAPNTTRLHLMEDSWQTWIYDVTVSGMVLERGHAPMYAMKAARYLQNPLMNSTNLLTEDVNYGDASVVRHMDVLALNASDMYACIATSGNPRASWGTKAAGTWHVPASDSYTVQGQPSYYVFAVPVADLSVFLTNVNRLIPQFRQTVQGVFFASSDLLTLGSTFTFAETTCYTVNASRHTYDFAQLEVTHFGYPAVYADIAKLYTSPYAHIEVTDENGNVDVIRIEDSTGTIEVSAALSIAYPFVTVDAHLMGAGGSAGATVTYRNVGPHTFDVQGRWYDTLRSWDVPTFAVILSPADEYDYSTHFDRAQAANDYTAAYSNATASAATSKANADASAATSKANADANADVQKSNADSVASSAKTNADASALTTRDNAKAKSDTAKANADASADAAYTNATNIATANKGNADDNADTLLANADTQQTANDDIRARSSQSATADTSLSNSLMQALQAWEAGYTRDTANNQVDAQYASAAIGAAGGAVGSAISGASAGASAGPVGAVAGAIGGLVQGAIGGATSMAQTAVAANLTTTQAEATVSVSQAKVSATSTNNTDRTNNQNSANKDNTDTANLALDTTSAESAATMKGNATRTRNAENAAATLTRNTEKSNNARSNTTEKANADATYDTDIANNARTYNTETANNAATQTVTKANAKRTYDTAIANNARTYGTVLENAVRTRDNAISAVNNGISQAALRAPFEFGAFANGSGAANKPMALFANIVTQSRAAISAAGDEFLRYGYRLDRQWDFDGNWCIGKYFTYWKLRDFWVSNLQVPDMYMDKLRFFLFGGVTIWRRPEDIGKISIYENWN